MSNNEWAKDDWLTDHMPGLMEVQTLLAKRLSDNPAVLYEQLASAESWHSRVTTMLADANARLDHAEYQALMSIRGDMTVDNRRIYIRNQVVNERRLRDIVDGLASSIKNRLMLGMNLRHQNSGERSNY